MGKIKRSIPFILAGIVCLLAVIPIFSNSVELDEAYSGVLVRGSIPEIVRGAAVDTAG